MGFIERRNGSYRARYRDPLGRQLSETFSRKLDAGRFLREVQVDIERGRWLDPRGAELTLTAWSEEFLSMARRLAPTTLQTYRRDLEKYILPRFGAYRIGRLPADEIEKWLMDEIDAGYAPSSVHRHYRTFRRMLQVAVVKEKILSNPFERVEPPHVPARETVFLRAGPSGNGRVRQSAEVRVDIDEVRPTPEPPGLTTMTALRLTHRPPP
ncbi:MAG TPA: site-specific integrase [Acidimicrobiales bacterium]|nr:site-specific integrase [Acidimicrobiales bacterium]